MKKMQKARAEALEAALGALSAGVGRDAAWTAEPEEVLTYAKFILGKRPAKKKRRRAIGTAYVDVKVRGGSGQPIARAYVAEQGAPLQKEPDATSSAPIGEDPGDRGVLTQWAEAIRQQDAAREAAREARDLEVDPEDEEVDSSLLKPLPPVEDREADLKAGAYPRTREELGTWATGIRERTDEREKQVRRDLSATWAPQRHEPEASEKAPDHVVTQGAYLGCPECSAEAKRRRDRDESLERGRMKLQKRPAAEEAGSWIVPLDEDELLAVAGSEVYPPNDEEPSRELKIRNRKGEVRVWKSGGAQDGYGWTSSPEDPWGLRYSWTSLEMSRRGPWHVV